MILLGITEVQTRPKYQEHSKQTMDKLQTVLNSVYTILGILLILVGFVVNTTVRVTKAQDDIDFLKVQQIQLRDDIKNLQSIDNRLSRIEGKLGVK